MRQVSSYFMNPSNTLIGMEIYPKTMMMAIALAAIFRYGVRRGWPSPTDWNMLHRPWLRWRPKRHHCKDVPGGNPPDLEAGNDVLIDVAIDEGGLRVDVTGCELKEMEDDEGQNDGAAPVHGAGGVGGVDGLSAGVSDRSGGLAAERKLNGCSNMQGDGEEHDAAFEPQNLAQVVEEVAVGVDVLGGLDTSGGCRAYGLRRSRTS